MLKPSIDFFLVMFALLKIGAVPVLIDPGIARSALKQCLAEAQPKAFIGIPLAQVAKLVLGWAPSVRLKVTTGAMALFGGKTLQAIERLGRASRHAACLRFIARRCGRHFVHLRIDRRAQRRAVPASAFHLRRCSCCKQAFSVEPGGVSLPTFPPFALFDPALGLTSVIPDMDPRQPGKADPEKLLHAINSFQVTQLFGSPALMKVLAEYGKPLPSLRCVISAGAPVPAGNGREDPRPVRPGSQILDALWRHRMPAGGGHRRRTAAADPCRHRSGLRHLHRLAGAGKYRAPDQASAMKRLSNGMTALLVEEGEIGELTVAGPSATDSYIARDASQSVGQNRTKTTRRRQRAHRAPHGRSGLAG